MLCCCVVGKIFKILEPCAGNAAALPQPNIQTKTLTNIVQSDRGINTYNSLGMAPHRRTKSSGPVPPSRTLIIDNGAYTMKAGFSSPTATSTPSVIPNCMARDREKRVYVGSQLEKCKDFGEIVFRRPVEKGYLVNWEAEKEIWDHEFFEDKAPLHCDPSETGLVLTEAPNALPQLQTNCDQIVFEEFGFASYLRCFGMPLALDNAANDTNGGV